MRIGTHAGLAAVSVAMAIGGCSDAAGDSAASGPAAHPAEAAPEAATVAAVTLSDTDLGRVCRGAVAALNGRDPAIIKVERIENGVAYVGYERPDDGKVWKNRCRVDGDRVIWASVDLDGPGSGPGRWRTHADDEIVTYALDGPTVKVRIGYGDGSGSEETYSIG